MKRMRRLRRAARPIRDFALGLILSALIVTCMVVEQPTQYAGPIETAQIESMRSMSAAPAMTVAVGSYAGGARATREAASIGLLALVFSSLVALNLWFARHLRRTYVGSRRQLRVVH